MKPVWLLWLAMGAWAAHAADAVNLAPLARISASGQLNAAYQAQFVADGKIPAPDSHADAGAAWCLPQAQAARAQLVFEWPAPVTVAEVVYYGRTAWLGNENFLRVQLFADGAAAPLAESALRPGHGPQRIRLPAPAPVRKLTLRFMQADRGPNPGASEVKIFDRVPAAAALGKFSAPGEPAAPPPLPQVSAVLTQQLARGALGFRELVLVERQPIRPSHVYTYHCEGLQPGGGLYILDVTTQKLRTLVDAAQGVILDCDVSFDGREILFSWMRDMRRFQVFRIRRDGTGLTQLTAGDDYNFNACWLPDGGIAFLSTRRAAFAYCWSSPAGILHRMDRDGRNVRQLSANYLNDFTPSVLADGRLIYARWEYVDRPAIPIQSLWTINPDGTGLQGFFGNRVLSPATFMEPHAVPGREEILCILTAHNGPCRGAIGLLDRRRGVNTQAAIRNLTPEVDIGRVDQGDGNHVRGPYESLCPLDAEHFLVSRDGALIVRNFAGTEQALVRARPGRLGVFNAQPLRARVVPPVVQGRIPADSHDETWATLYLQDVYAGLAPAVRRGEIKELRVVQEIAKPVSVDPARRLFGFQFPVVSCGATYAPKKIWGTARVEADGSASFRVPPNVPLYFMALDAEGRALQRMRSFTHLAPGEVQGCVGCHDDRLTAPPRTARPLAMLRAPQDLTPPDWGVAGFSYAQVVQPVLDRHCVACHNARQQPRGVDLSGDLTDLFNVSYETLARRGTPAEDPHRGGASMAQFHTQLVSWIPTYNGAEANILEIRPRAWGSPASPLAELVRAGHPDAAGRPRVRLADAERRRLFAWMDCNVPYYPTSASHDVTLPGCRRLYPAQLDATLAGVAARRCATCHTGGKVPRQFFVRITHPQDNPFLLAPLAQAAGGTGACGQPVFASTGDPDYQAILRTFADLLQQLRERPRLDILAETNPAP